MSNPRHIGTVSRGKGSTPTLTRRLDVRLHALTFVFGVLSLGSAMLVGRGSIAAPQHSAPLAQNSDRGSDDRFSEAISHALRAADLAQSARSPTEWDRVARAWLQAISLMQAVPLDSPKRAFAQKKVSEYLQNLAYVLPKTRVSGAEFPTFDSQLLDEKLALYRSYVAAIGAPDILIVGSSRALQGIDPKPLQQALAQQGYGGYKIFNFGVNGATARVVDAIVRQILTSDRLPRLILWADGARAFNSGRADRTYDAIISSPGYQRLASENTRSLDDSQNQEVVRLEPLSPMGNSLDANGFLPVSDRFDPRTYYYNYPRVSGRYDGDYQNFNLGGEQKAALDRLLAYTRSRQIPVVFVNLPLTQDYLDAVRSRAHRQFAQAMQRTASENNLVFRDFSQRFVNRNGYFEDPSHLNRYGAAEVARQLARESGIPWLQTKP